MKHRSIEEVAPQKNPSREVGELGKIDNRLVQSEGNY